MNTLSIDCAMKPIRPLRGLGATPRTLAILLDVKKIVDNDNHKMIIKPT